MGQPTHSPLDPALAQKLQLEQEWRHSLIRAKPSLTPDQLNLLSFALCLALLPVTWCMYLHWKSLRRRYDTGSKSEMAAIRQPQVLRGPQEEERSDTQSDVQEKDNLDGEDGVDGVNGVGHPVGPGLESDGNSISAGGIRSRGFRAGD